MVFSLLSLFSQIEHKDLASTLDKLKAQHPSLYIPTSQSDGLDDDNNTLSDDIKPFSEMTAATPMDISRLVSHLSNAVATAREEVSTLLQDLQPLKEKVITLKDECGEKKKVDRISLVRTRLACCAYSKRIGSNRMCTCEMFGI